MRAVGALDMSVGTSLAFELGGDTAITADTLLFNLWTLVRNAMQAYEATDPDYNNVKKLTNDVEKDLILISQWLETNRKARPIQMIVYCPSYKGLRSKFRHADLYEPKAGSKKEINSDVAQEIVRALLKKHDKLIKQTDVDLPAFNGRGVIMTHHVVDLVTTNSTARLFLLESHTGVVKDFTQWYTKLTGGDKLHYIPFNSLTLQVFGDNSTNFKSSSHGIKELVKKIALEAKWTSATSVSRVRSTIGSIAQGADKAGLLMMF